MYLKNRSLLHKFSSKFPISRFSKSLPVKVGSVISITCTAYKNRNLWKVIKVYYSKYLSFQASSLSCRTPSAFVTPNAVGILERQSLTRDMGCGPHGCLPEPHRSQDFRWKRRERCKCGITQGAWQRIIIRNSEKIHGEYFSFFAYSNTPVTCTVK